MIVVVALVAAVVVPATITRSLGPCYAAGWRGGQQGEAIGVGQNVEDVARAGRWVWALGDRSVIRVDPATRAAAGTISFDAATTGQVVGVGDHAWVTGKGPGTTGPGAASPRLWRVDPAMATPSATVELGTAGDDIAAVAPAEGDRGPGLWVLLRRSAPMGDRLDLAWVDATSAEVVTVEVGPEGRDRLPGSPWADGVGLAADGRRTAWVEASDRLWRVELEGTRPNVRPVAAPAGVTGIGGLTFAAGSLFAVAGEGDVVRLDPTNGARTASAPLPAPASGRVRTLGDTVWVDTLDGLAHIDAAGRIVGVVGGVAPSVGAAAGEGAVWVTSFRLDVTSRFDRQRDNLLLRVDPATTTVTGSWVPGCAPGTVVAGEGALWMASFPSSAVLVVDP